VLNVAAGIVAAVSPITAIVKTLGSDLNAGFASRQLRTLSNSVVGSASKTLNLFLPIRKIFKMFEYNTSVFRGIKHTIKLYKNTNWKTLFMHTSAAGDGQLQITDISWWVPALRPSIEYGLHLDKQLNSGMKTKLMWNQLKCYPSPEFTAGTGVGSQTSWRITSAGNKPVKIYIVFRTANQYTSGLSQQYNNAMLFQHMNITNINLRINSLQFPKDEFRADFVTNDDWGRLYMEYLKMTGKMFDVDGGGYPICYDDFKMTYPIFCFDLTKQDPQIWANVTQAELQLFYTRATFSPATADPYNGMNFKIYAVIEFEKFIELQGADNRLRVIM